MGRKSRFESETLQYAYNRYVGRDKKKAEAFEAELANAEVARKLYDLRVQAGLTQAALAKLVGTTASVISRLEDADYDGHSLMMLRRLAAGLNKRVEIRFVPLMRATARARKAPLCEPKSQLGCREYLRHIVGAEVAPRR